MVRIIKILSFTVIFTSLFSLFSPLLAETSYSKVSLVPPTFTFQNDLKLGDNNVDVFFLQIVLNSDPVSAISSDANFGAPGKETTYFGGLTQAAVIRFQEKYASEILTPLGLLHGTGFVGPSTRAKLNQVLDGLRAAVTNTSTTGTSTATTGSSSNNDSTGASLGAIGGAAGLGIAGGVVSNQLLKPFGGQIYFVDYYSCSCSGGILVWVKDKVPPYLIKKLVYQAGVSRLNSYYNLFIPGNQTVGSYTPIPTICLTPGNPCVQSYNDGLITPSPFPGVGTTLTPTGV